MEYCRQLRLKNGKGLTIQNGTAEDAEALLRVYLQTHEETDLLASYPDESTHTVEQEADFLRAMEESANEVELLAAADGTVVGCASVSAVGRHYKERHRADLGISVVRDYWHMGIGRALTLACIECAKAAGYVQLELTVVAENEKAIALYESVGFMEYGRNPKGFRSRFSGWQETVHMRLEL